MKQIMWVKVLIENYESKIAELEAVGWKLLNNVTVHIQDDDVYCVQQMEKGKK